MLLGSERLNKMSAEIDKIVRDLISPLKNRPFDSFDVRVYQAQIFQDCFWRVTCCPGEKPFVRCVEEWREGEGGGSEVTMYSNDSPTHACYIAKVHSALNALAEDMLKRFPVVHLALSPVLVAAERA